MDDRTYTNGGIAILVFLALVFLGLRYLQGLAIPTYVWIALAVMGAFLMVMPVIVFWLLIPIALVVGMRYNDQLQGLLDKILNLKIGG